MEGFSADNASFSSGRGYQVFPEFRGEGIGKTLVQYAEEERHASQVDVNEQNTQAVAFYQRMGFASLDAQSWIVWANLIQFYTWSVTRYRPYGKVRYHIVSTCAEYQLPGAGQPGDPAACTAGRRPLRRL
ncbi:GNAT family N-acetyltransferase [Pontibacter lucknowensis]|uniref:GNAT family N-acetyltransferase n=1 Tax=Pontibacter lucknowensis TaxID=1077936 RepID=UPI002936FC27|nr:GNAT family N-acetyltransferase [Pontibacter lucknowensis]